MNIINKLTLNHMKQNRKRTVVTIIGVIISIILITTAITIVISFMDFMRRDEIARNGYWHVEYKNVSKEEINRIRNYQNTEQMFLSRELGFSNLNELQKKDKPYVFIKEYDSQGFKNNNIEIIKGRLPKNSNEIVLSENIYNNERFNYTIGETLNLDLGKRLYKAKQINNSKSKDFKIEAEEEFHIEDKYGGEVLVPTSKKDYKVVGIVKSRKDDYSISSAYKAFSFIDNKNEVGVNAGVVLKNINMSTTGSIKDFSKENNMENMRINDRLLTFSGAIDNDKSYIVAIATILAMMLGIISLISVALIYNAFSISVSERNKYLGILSSVGATRKQKRKAVFFEAKLIYLISMPLGILLGLTGMGITFEVVNNIIPDIFSSNEKFELNISFVGISLIIIFSALTVFISAVKPAIKSSKMTAIEAIRQHSDIKLTKKKIRTSKVTKRIFGIEADIALKNLKRNKGKYLVTIFSLAISVILFISISYFGETIRKNLNIGIENTSYDIVIWGEKSNSLTREDINKKFSDVFKKVKDYSINSNITPYISLDASRTKVPDYINKEVKKVNGRYDYPVGIIALDERSFNKYIKEIGANIDDFNLNNKVSGIYIDTLNYFEEESGKFIEEKSFDFKENEKIQLSKPNKGEIEIVKITSKLPMGVDRPDNYSPITIITSIKDFNLLLEDNKDLKKGTLTSIYLKNTEGTDIQRELDIIEEQNKEDIHINNLTLREKENNNIILIMSIFIYEFIGLITLVTVANIFNTISTSIALRGKEFAMLKSVGMDEKSFNKMIRYESVFYGLKSILYGIPIGLIITGLMHHILIDGFRTSYNIHWFSIVIVIIGIFLIVGLSMVYSSSKIKKESIIGALKNDNI